MTVQKFPFYNVTTKTKPFGWVFLYPADAQTVLRSNAQPVFILKKRLPWKAAAFDLLLLQL